MCLLYRTVKTTILMACAPCALRMRNAKKRKSEKAKKRKSEKANKRISEKAEFSSGRALEAAP